MTKPAARMSDLCVHPGTAIVSGSPDVLIGYMPAARESDLTTPCGTVCYMPLPGKVAKGSSSVFTNSRMAARMGDPVACGLGSAPPSAGGVANPLGIYEVRDEDNYVASIFGDDRFLAEEPVKREGEKIIEVDPQPERGPSRFLEGLSLDLDLGGAPVISVIAAGPNLIVGGSPSVLIGD
jgi:uncharacterized Zn-binding protein involved in type VI secretion